MSRRRRSHPANEPMTEVRRPGAVAQVSLAYSLAHWTDGEALLGQSFSPAAIPARELPESKVQPERYGDQSTARG